METEEKASAGAFLLGLSSQSGPNGPGVALCSTPAYPQTSGFPSPGLSTSSTLTVFGVGEGLSEILCIII